MKAGFSRRISYLIPKPNDDVFCWSLGVGVIAIPLAAITYGWAPLPIVSAYWACAIEWAMPIVHILSGLYLLWVAHHYIMCVPPTTNGRIFSILGPVTASLFVIALVTLIEYTLLKPGFLTDRPPQQLIDLSTCFGPFESMMRHLRGSGTSTPSGYTMRQVVIGLYTIQFIQQRGWEGKFLLSRSFAKGATISAVAVVGSGRILSASHYPFDVAAGVAFGVFLFWWINIIVNTILREQDEEDELAEFNQRFAVPASVIFLIALAFWKSPGHWAIFSGMSFLSLVYVSSWHSWRRCRVSKKDQNRSKSLPDF